MDINCYLKRIKYSGSRVPAAETLRQLHRAHLLTIPFENLDIHLGHTIILDDEKFFEKMVRQRRGGFCYELNGLFAALLRALGFKVTMLSARVNLEGILGPEFDHMVLLVQLEERWLADVGFGALFIEPLRMDDRKMQIQSNYAYRVKKYGDNWKVMARETGVPWKVFYQFTLEPRQLQDYAQMCQWHQTSPRSWHTQNRICTRATPDGRVTLTETKLVIKKNSERSELPISTKEEYADALRTHFGIEIGEISKWE